jgi:DNA-binding NtrC family response regulator
MHNPTLLVAEDEPVQRLAITTMLESVLGYEVIAVTNGKQAFETVQQSNVGDISAILLDISMPEMDGFEALKHIRKYRPDIPVLMLTAEDDTNVAVKAIKAGAADFIVKPPEPSHLDVAITNAIKLSALSRELARVKRDTQGALSFQDIVGHHAGLAEAIGFGRKAAASNVPVLISGETGVGKELFARALHGESRRVGGPFIAINCGAIPANLVESILFGHEKGAFTGAVARTLGKFREAEGGTIFLDEIGDLPAETQVKLLRVLQEQEVEPVGASRPVKVDVRILSATHRDLADEVKAGRFREDLYFRLNVLPITVPPLRERRSDILPLADYFIQRFQVTDQLPPRTLNEKARHYLTGHHWPGNVRELENLIRRAMVLSEDEHIDRELLKKLHASTEEAARQVIADGRHIPLFHNDGTHKTMDEIEREAIALSLAHHAQNITQTATALGMAKSTFYRKIKDAGAKIRPIIKQTEE